MILHVKRFLRNVFLLQCVLSVCEDGEIGEVKEKSGEAGRLLPHILTGRIISNRLRCSEHIISNRFQNALQLPGLRTDPYLTKIFTCYLCGTKSEIYEHLLYLHPHDQMIASVGQMLSIYSQPISKYNITRKLFSFS